MSETRYRRLPPSLTEGMVPSFVSVESVRSEMDNALAVSRGGE